MDDIIEFVGIVIIEFIGGIVSEAIDSVKAKRAKRKLKKELDGKD